jgi:hypothetical protein
VRSTVIAAAAALAFLGGCAMPSREAAPHGSQHVLRLQQPPDQAAACFARNAEEHSSALVSEIRPAGESAHVTVRVKNGVTYATASFERAGSGSRGTVNLNVSTTGRRSDLLDALVAGC